jgi:biopolymer transport protein ExbD
MKLSKSREDNNTEMDMTPMIDCVFQLIIFFMLITDMSQKDLEVLYLPKVEVADPDKPDPQKVRPVVNVLSDGSVWIKGKQFYDPNNPDDYAKLRLHLSQAVKFMPKKPSNPDAPASKDNPLLPDNPLLIRADQSCPSHFVQKIMEVCGTEGIQIWKIELAAAELNPEAPGGAPQP